MTIGTSKVTGKGQVTIPADMRKSLGLGAGENVVFVEMEDWIMLRAEGKVQEALQPFKDRRRELGFTKAELLKEAREARKRRTKNA
ncbi:MAG: AbrB/MazE/SpoVT family DNA-binding domain-containing protein [Methanobacteriota archaeon]